MYKNTEEKYDIDEAMHVRNIFKLVFELLGHAIMIGGNSLTCNYLEKFALVRYWAEAT